MMNKKRLEDAKRLYELGVNEPVWSIALRLERGDLRDGDRTIIQVQWTNEDRSGDARTRIYTCEARHLRPLLDDRWYRDRCGYPPGIYTRRPGEGWRSEDVNEVDEEKDARLTAYWDKECADRAADHWEPAHE